MCYFGCVLKTIEEILHISFPAGENDRNSDLMAIRFVYLHMCQIIINMTRK
jgi:hypothetical protein